MKKLLKSSVTALLLLLAAPLGGQTIAEKKAGFSGGSSDLTGEMQTFLVQVNRELKVKQDEVRALYREVEKLHDQNAPPITYKTLLLKINTLKEEIASLQESWKEVAIDGMTREEDYALWHQPKTTLEQLVIDYGSLDYVYLIPPEVTSIQVSVSSNLPIPRASWTEMLEAILEENGVGMREINPYLRQLYLASEDLSGLRAITNERGDLELFPSDSRVSFVLTPEPADVRRTWLFLDKFANHKSTSIQMVGRDILIVGQVAAVKELLKINDFVAANKGFQDYKAITLRRVEAEEMAKILTSIFEGLTEEMSTTDTKGAKGGSSTRFSGPKGESNGLRVITMSNVAQALFLIGTKEEIRKAEEIIQQVENQVGEASEKSVYWYTVRHSDPEELAGVLERIYNLMIETRVIVDQGKKSKKDGEEEVNKAVEKALALDLAQQSEPPTYVIEANPGKIYRENFYQQGGYVINPTPVEAGGNVYKEPNKNRKNFIVDPKSSSIVMVIEAYILPKMKEIARKLDIPKKMVQIEVLLFEKVLTRNTQYGLSLLRTSSCASDTHKTCFNWNDVNPVGGTSAPGNLGVFEFLLSRTKADTGVTAFDLGYRFLISQDDVQLNASPSVVTVNQTPARISIIDEISISTGVFETPQTDGGVALKDAFTRAQYGITMEITPTIHMRDEEASFGEEIDYITLVSKINFDSIGVAVNNRPPVNRREIVNEVRIPDGQTVIIGGLRRKDIIDKKDSIPFLGEIPGFGKLFSFTDMQDNDKEMFVFITAKIIDDPKEDFYRLRREQLCYRPGDIPAFLCCKEEAYRAEKYRTMQGTMQMLFGRPKGRCVWTEGEYDGR